MAAVLAAIGGVVAFMAGSFSGEAGSITLGLCGLSAPDKALIGLYLETRSEELELPAGTDDTPVAFVVEPGETVVEIADGLQEAGLISDAELFRRYVQHEGLDSGIEAGHFELRQTMTIREIAQALQSGRRQSQMVTIREGLRLEQVAEEVAAQTGIAHDEFLRVATTGWRQLQLPAYDFLAQIPVDGSLEGFLWPDTYELTMDAAADDLILLMLNTFDRRVTQDIRMAANDSGLDVYQLTTLASIIEREAVRDDERSVISSVFHNRLSAGWFLGSCPTVQYGLGEPGTWWPSLTLDDLDLDLPYSTYRNPGLPPGPICSPGLAAIEAAARPAQTGYYFFLVDCERDDGSHLFAATEAEHLANYDRCGSGLP